MVEMLITVAILGLLIAVFLLWLRPDDDRRCRLEAQRLAAYLIEAEANALMRDGPVRVAFAFAENTGKREFRRSSASLAEQGWELDPKADVHRVGSPVQLESIETPLAGAVKGGNAWLNFNGARTPGGVAILVLNEAAYSVLVPPQGQGQIKVEKGRASLKDPKTFQWAQPGSIPELAFDPGGDLPTALPPSLAGGPAPPNPAPPVSDAPQPTNEPEPVADSPQPTNEPPPPSEPPVNPPQEEPEAQPEEEPEEEPEAECRAHSDCIATMGDRGVCVGGPTGQPNQEDPTQNRCRANLEGLGYRVRRAQVTKPDGFGGLLEPVLNSYIVNGNLNLVVYLQNVISWEQSNDGYRARYLSWSFNANSNTSTVVQPNPNFPTSRADSRAVPACGQPYTSCHDIISQEQTDEGTSQKLELWLPRVGSNDPDVCPHQLLEVVGTLNISVDTTGASGSAYVRLSGIITRAAARRLDIKLPGQPLQTLKALFENNGINPTYDWNGDTFPDSWEIAFEGPAVPVGVTGNLEGARSNNPCQGYE